MEHAATSPSFSKNVSRQHDIPFKIKIFAERYPFFIGTTEP